MTTPLIKVEGLRKSFNGQPILDGVDFEIYRGESVVVIGQSGCGKSVLLKHIMRLLDPDEGRVIFDGQDIGKLSGRDLNEVRLRIGMLFQSASLFDSMTVAENVGLCLKEMRRHTHAERNRIVMEKLELVGLTDAASKKPDEISGGMRKRVGLARAIATDPEMLLYDEPTTGLDPITADLINDLIIDLTQKLDVTSIAVTHDMTAAYKVASRIFMLYEGKIEFDGTPDEIRASDKATVQQFITGRAKGPIKVR